MYFAKKFLEKLHVFSTGFSIQLKYFLYFLFLTWRIHTYLDFRPSSLSSSGKQKSLQSRVSTSIDADCDSTNGYAFLSASLGTSTRPPVLSQLCVSSVDDSGRQSIYRSCDLLLDTNLQDILTSTCCTVLRTRF